jgi:hypothetical protein
VAFALAAPALGIVLPGTPGAGAATAHMSTAASALPTGWELCILKGLGAHPTDANVADLDTWQAAEGGATANGIAFNPFNTRRGTDQSGAPVPASYTPNGFPVFSDWPAGCAATVATILQPNMDPIAAALAAGTVSPAADFLTTVDQTPWCAPSDGVPCYAELIGSRLAITTGDALGLVKSAGDALGTYDQDVATTADLSRTLASDQAQLSTAEVEVTLAHLTVTHAAQSLRSLAIYDYTSNPSLEHMAALLGRFHPPSQTDMLSQYYLHLDASSLVGQYQHAEAALGQAEAARSVAAVAVAHTTKDLDAADAATTRALGNVGAQLTALATAWVCTAPPAGAPPDGSDPASVAALRGCVASLTTERHAGAPALSVRRVGAGPAGR